MDLEYLSKKYHHERDNHITFDEGPHIYTIDGDSSFTSVTTWNHSHFKPFDSDLIIDRMMASKKWPNSKYYGQTKEEIKNLWKANGVASSNAGTKMHYDIECFYNNNKVEIIANNIHEACDKLKSIVSEYEFINHRFKIVVDSYKGY